MPLTSPSTNQLSYILSIYSHIHPSIHPSISFSFKTAMFIGFNYHPSLSFYIHLSPSFHFNTISQFTHLDQETSMNSPDASCWTCCERIQPSLGMTHREAPRTWSTWLALAAEAWTRLDPADRWVKLGSFGPGSSAGNPPHIWEVPNYGRIWDVLEFQDNGTNT